MPIPTLKQSAAAAIPVSDVPVIYDFLKVVIHQELSPFVRPRRYMRPQRLLRLCSCSKTQYPHGKCLCYFTYIRKDMIDQFWGEETEYELLGDFCTFE